jgi:hypothetical protein
MFERPHHQKIAKLLHAMDDDLLAEAKCYFGGGTAIALQLGEYRESIDVDFLCSDKDGYRLLRNAITPPTLGAILRSPVKHIRDVRTQRDKISTFLEIDEIPVRVAFVLEGRIDISGAIDPALSVPVLSREDMYAEKLLANADRALDRSQMSRDLIDLAMMIEAWRSIPATPWKKRKVPMAGPSTTTSTAAARHHLSRRMPESHGDGTQPWHHHHRHARCAAIAPIPPVDAPGLYRTARVS